jgi:eukaryotic-like serine/threonine-protein kinase
MGDGERLAIGRYRLVVRLGEGGEGTVWLAVATDRAELGRLYAVKLPTFIKSGSPDAVQDFLREARLAAAVRSVHVVEVLEFGEEDGGPFLVMPYVEGESLRALLGTAGEMAAPRCEPAIAVRIAIDALTGLHAIHEAASLDGRRLGIVHRDVSPHNLLVTLDGLTRVTDFGIARPTLRAAAEVTSTGWTAKGKIAYFCPEQSRGERLDRRSDVFSMSIVLWEMLAGRSLFRTSEDMLVTLHNVQTLVIPDLTLVAPSTPVEIARAVAKGLERDPERRFPTAQAMARALLDASKAGGLHLGHEDVAAWVRSLAGERVAERARMASAALVGTPRTGAPLALAQAEQTRTVLLDATAALPHARPPRAPAPPAPSRGRAAALSIAIAIALALGFAALAVVAAPRLRRAAAEDPAPAPAVMTAEVASLGPPAASAPPKTDAPFPPASTAPPPGLASTAATPPRAPARSSSPVRPRKRHAPVPPATAAASTEPPQLPFSEDPFQR